jgi:AcrR family transcriptional regulator
MSGAALGTEPVSRETMASHQREAVLDRVTDVFAKRGYQGTTVDDLLAAGKIGVTNFYSLFEGKEECFLAAFERIAAAARERIELAAGRGSGWAESSYLGLAELSATMLEAPLRARLVLVEAQSAGPGALGRQEELLEAAGGWLARGRKSYPAAEGLPAGYERAAVAGISFYLQQCLIDSRSHTAAELTGELAQTVLEPIVGAAELRRLAKAAAL